MKQYFREDFENAFYWFCEHEKWDPDISHDLITCVFALVTYWDKLYLTKNHRGWELPWWHVETWENLEQALERELKEEVWTTIHSSSLFGYKKYTNYKKLPNREWWFYPFPHSYILFYIAEWTWEDHKIECPDTLDYGLFSYEEALEKIDSPKTRELVEIIAKHKKNNTI